MPFLYKHYVSSCNQPLNIIDTSKVPIDSLASTWVGANNKHDSETVTKFFSDALFIYDNLTTINAVELSGKWIHPNIILGSNINSTKLQSCSTGDRSYDTDKYELDVDINNSIIANRK